jgi:uncharacterized MAPEG superfamily protein
LLTFFYRIAQPLYRFRWVLWVLLLIAGGLFAAAVLGIVAGEDLPLASFLACLWMGFVIAFANAFMAPIPEIRSGAGWLSRLKVRLRRGLLWLIAVGTVILFAFVVLFSIRALGLLLG